MHSSFGLTEKQHALRLAQQRRKLAWEAKRREEAEKNEIVVIPPKDLTENQLAWIRKHSQPKVRRVIYMMPAFSRWAKRGPMGRSDWLKFLKWADVNAEPKPEPKPHCKIEEPVKKQKSALQISQEELWDDIDKLAKPKRMRKKYIYPAPIKYTYSPKTNSGATAHHDRGRPFPPPQVPAVFQHIDLETEFWSTLRFPIRPSALRYTASESLIEFAQPRITPPLKPHCPIPPKPVEYVEPRKRMSRKQWLSHIKRLNTLAAPVKRYKID